MISDTGSAAPRLESPQTRAPSGSARSRLVGAVVAQGTQAFGGLLLSVAAARLLGAAGLGVFALVYGVVVLATAVSSGLVGDSLVVLDRSDPAVRSGLVWWSVGVTAAAGAVALPAAWIGGLPTTAVLACAAATSAFMLQDLARRALMAVRRFWALVVVDGVGIAVMLAVIAVGVTRQDATLALILAALAVGQTVSVAVAACFLRRSLHRWRPTREPGLRQVWHFGSWQAAGQAVRPTALTIMRTLVVVAVGAAAYGPLEAARVYTAPLIVLITGVNSFMLPHYVGRRDRPVTENLGVADRTVLGLAVACLGLGGVAMLLLPVAGPLLTGGGFEVPALAVAGWSLFAACGAALLPYAGLAAALREQRRLLLLRSLEVPGLLVVALVVGLVPDHPSLVPFAMAVGPASVALAVRQRILVSMAAGQPIPGAGVLTPRDE
jgi:O-antigen/teichoic acid export membrane protein